MGVTRFPPIFLSRLTNTIRVPENLCLTPVSLFCPHFVSVPASTFTHTYTQQLHNTKTRPITNQTTLTYHLIAGMWIKQQSIAIMNMNLQDIQQDIHRLATQQSQMQAQHLQAQQLMQAQQIANMLNQVIHPPITHCPTLSSLQQLLKLTKDVECLLFCFVYWLGI